MGYRSDIALTMTKEGYRSLLNGISGTEQEKEQIKSVLMNDLDEIRVNEHSLTIIWDWYKWYSSDPGVAYIENAMQKTDFTFHFIRIGEDSEDIEIDSNDPDGILTIPELIQTIDVTGTGKAVNIPQFFSELTEERTQQ